MKNIPGKIASMCIAGLLALTYSAGLQGKCSERSANGTYAGRRITESSVTSKNASSGIESLLSVLGASKQTEKNKYAVIISGADDARYEENITLAYRTFLVNGFLPGNIFILEGDGKIEGYCPYPVKAPASKKNLRSVLQMLESKVNDESVLAIYVTGHGIRNKESEILVRGKNITESDLEQWLSGIHPKEGILIFDQCFGGGFAERLGKREYVAVSASKKDEESMEGTFPDAFFGAWKTSKADENKDGKISIGEAFKYAFENDRHAVSGEQSPQLVSDIDADSVFLSEK